MVNTMSHEGILEKKKTRVRTGGILATLETDKWVRTGFYLKIKSDPGLASGLLISSSKKALSSVTRAQAGVQ